jgi:hypothetical protein
VLADEAVGARDKHAASFVHEQPVGHVAAR